MTIELATDQEETSEQHGYDPRTVPLGGRYPIHEEFCRCEDTHLQQEVSCGCAFGQCAKGLIY